MTRFELYKDSAGEYRWRFLARNGEIVATSGEGYVAKVDCLHGIDLIKSQLSRRLPEGEERGRRRRHRSNARLRSSVSL